jgi:hypothetical protein
MNTSYGGYAQRPRGVPTWAVVLIVCGGLFLIGFASAIGYAVISVAKEAVKYERVHQVLDEDYRRYRNGQDISAQKPFDGSDSISAVGNYLHEMVRLLQIEYKLFQEEYDNLDWFIDEQFKSISSASAYNSALSEIEKSIDPYERFASSKELIVREYSELTRQAARRDSTAQEIADFYIAFEHSDLAYGKTFTDVVRDLAEARKERLGFVWSNRKWFSLGAGGKWVLVSAAPAAIQNELDKLESEVGRLHDQLEEIYDSWGSE